jgi:hypothetical protein
MYLDNPVYEDRPQIDSWLKLLIGLVLGVTLVLGLVFIKLDRVGAIVLFAVTLFDALLFYCVTPRSYQIYSDRLKIRLGGPFSKTLFFKDVTSFKRVEGGNALASCGLRFSPSTRYVVEIRRKGKISVTLSPSGGEQFVEQLGQAVKNYTG